jgi:putative DNA primase/helicase
VRIIDVPVAPSKHGLFQNIQKAKNGAEFADALRDAAAKHHGHAGPSFIKELIDQYQKVSLSAMLANKLVSFGTNLSAQDTRVARSFAIIALAGELAITWGVLPWDRGTASTAAVEIFKHWKSTQPQSTKSKETEQILKAVRDFIDAHGNSRFLDINWSRPVNPKTGLEIDKDPLIRDQAGYFDDSSGSRVYLFTSGGLHEATKGFDFKRVLEALEEAGAFAKVGATQKSVTRRIPEGGSKDLYHIDPTKLQP